MIEKIIEIRAKFMSETGIIPKYLYLGEQAHKDLKEEAEKYLEDRDDRAFPELVPAKPKVKLPEYDSFMGMIIEVRENLDPDAIVVR